jgi:hypothetical protein
MSANDWIFWVVFSIVANNYFFILVLLRRWPQLKFRTYVMNLGGLSMCALSAGFAALDPVWTAIFLLNLIFQNVLLVHPKGTGYVSK